ncbi:hypothetical protein [Neobacillus mesonae]|uniref:DUF2726 domain-containing protein n=1 Tax=Neobacillus mesonae TaxID=1193713 RepID=A0A3T0HVH0_9BACI|nr:hypothetical protein [Neobacillus mesonae]AZU61076.1 hypothetical protein CHR53_07310 [Neobacillus mesonae]
MCKRKTHEVFVSEVLVKLGVDYTVLSKYQNAKTPVELIHSCGHKYSCTPNKILSRGQRCPKCFNRHKSKVKNSTDNFLINFTKLANGEYELLSEYKGVGSYITVKHVYCDHIYNVRPGNFISGRRCPKCGEVNRANSRSKTISEVKAAILEKFGSKIELLEYSGRIRTKSKFFCNKCNQAFETTCSSLLAKNNLFGCRYCYLSNRETGAFTKEEIQHKFDEVWPGEYLLISKEVKWDEFTQVLHKGCGGVFDVHPYAFIKRQSCCLLCESSRVSRGEKRIMKYLESERIPYKMQYSFDDLVLQKALKFDFAILHEDKPLMLIEFDGEQHFKSVEHFGGDEKFEITKLRDEIKNQYCRSKNIKLLRIPYWEIDNVENILEREVSGF